MTKSRIGVKTIISVCLKAHKFLKNSFPIPGLTVGAFTIRLRQSYVTNSRLVEFTSARVRVWVSVDIPVRWIHCGRETWYAVTLMLTKLNNIFLFINLFWQPQYLWRRNSQNHKQSRADTELHWLRKLWAGNYPNAASNCGSKNLFAWILMRYCVHRTPACERNEYSNV